MTKTVLESCQKVNTTGPKTPTPNFPPGLSPKCCSTKKILCNYNLQHYCHVNCQNILFPKKKKSLQVLSKQGKMVWGLFLYPTTKSVETYF